MLVRTLYYLKKLRKNQWLRPRELENLQNKKLRAIVKYAYENVPFYHRTFRLAGVKPDKIENVNDLSNLPILRKSDLQNSFRELISKNVNVNKCTKDSSSGSIGKPVTVTFDKKGLDLLQAMRTRSLVECGFRMLKDKHFFIVHNRRIPHEKRWYQYFGLWRQGYVSIYDRIEDQISKLREFKPDIIESYPSALWLLAKAIREEEIKGIYPRLIFTTAELLDKENRRSIESTFCAEVLDRFGCVEVREGAWECNEHAGYHINVDGVVMEFLKDGEPVVAGERGRITYTSLHNYAMPLIRYDVGDVGVPSNEECPCGRGLPLMKVVEGRADDFVVAPDGRLFSPLMFFPFPFEGVLGIVQFKVTQNKIDKLTIELVIGESFPRNVTSVWEKAEREVKKVFGENMEVEFRIVEEIPREPSGKLRKVVSLLRIGWR